MKKLIAIAVLAVAGALAVPTAASAASLQGGTCNNGNYVLSTSTNSAAPGATVHVSACLNAAPGTSGSVSFSGGAPTSIVPASAQTFTVGATGAVTFNVQIPSNATNGQQFTVGASAGDSTLSGVITAVVPSTSGLPSTGVDATPFVIGGASLLVVGGIVVGLSFALRRRRQHTAA